jgi:hypothetical protein
MPPSISCLSGPIGLAHTQGVQVLAEGGEIGEHQRTDLLQYVGVRTVRLPPHQDCDPLGQAPP